MAILKRTHKTQKTPFSRRKETSIKTPKKNRIPNVEDKSLRNKKHINPNLGRPKKPDHLLRNRKVTSYFSRSEELLLERAAALNDMGKAEFIRKVVKLYIKENVAS